MALQTKTTYCRETTLSHPLTATHPKAVIQLNTLLKREGSGKVPFADEIVIDLDEAEVINKTGKSGRESTMDFCIGLSCRQMLLVEAKLRVAKPTNLGRSELDNKVNYSKHLLGHEIPIAKDTVVLFNNKVVEQAKRHLARLYSNKSQIQALTIADFKNRYFFPSA